MIGLVGDERYRVDMSFPAEHTPPAHPAPPPPPTADPVSIRERLSPQLVAEFDTEWRLVLDEAKESKDLTGVHSLLNKWRHIAVQEMREPGSYYRVLAKAEQILRTGTNPDALPHDEAEALVQRWRGR